MAGDSNVYVPIELPSEIMAQMPQDLTFAEKREWFNKKAAEFRAKQEQEAAAAAQASHESSQQAESDEKADISADDVPAEKTAKQSGSQKPKTTQKRTRGSLKASDEIDTKYIRSVPQSVISALKRIFPDAQNNSDLVSAVAYIFTSGDCKIPQSAMELVKSYNSDDAISNLSEQIANLSRAVHALDKRTSAIELCACYDLYDRRYGAKERRKSPKENEFREQGNLDMLHRLRVQAEDQRRLDDIERGRSIYESTKDKNDNKN